MLEGENLTLELIAKTDRKPEYHETPVIDENSKSDFIQIGDKVYEIPSEMLRYFGDHSDHLPDRIDRAVENGMAFMYDHGGFSCFYCNHYTSNVANLVLDEQGRSRGFVMKDEEGAPGIIVKDCTYQGTGNVRWATPLLNVKDGSIVLAQQTPCVVHESMIIVLAEKGVLDEYEVQDREFDFPNLADIGNGLDKIDDRFILRKPSLLYSVSSSVKDAYSSLKTFLIGD